MTTTSVRRSMVALLVVCGVVLGLPRGALALPPTETVLTASDSSDWHHYGYSVAATSSRIVVGAMGHDDYRGAVYVYDVAEGGGFVETRLLASDRVLGDRFGVTVATIGDRIVVGAPGDPGRRGSVYVFDPDGNGGFTETKLMASDGAGSDGFGVTVAVTPTRVVVGAPGDRDHGVNTGAVYVYDANSSGGFMETKLVASDGAARDLFGIAVAASGTRIVVGARGDGDKGSNSGSAYVFDPAGPGSFKQTKLVASDGRVNAGFGAAVATSGKRVVVGAPGDSDSRHQGGSVYVLDASGGGFRETKLWASDWVEDGAFGWSLAVAGDRFVVGASLGRESWQGMAYVFGPDGHGGLAEARIRPTRYAEMFGAGVAIGGSRIVVGAPSTPVGVSESAGLALVYEGDLALLCRGLVPTIVGTNGADVIDGTPGADVISAGGGSDTVRALGGADVICGGSGADTLVGGPGDDVLDGGSGNDILSGEAGADKLYGGTGDDKAFAGVGNDVVDGGSGNDEMRGGDGRDTLNGGSGADALWGEIGVDIIRGGSGDDRLFGGPSNDQLWGGDGKDALDGGDGHDSLRGGSGNDLLGGGLGNDVLWGGEGNDTLVGGTGSDQLLGGAGGDLLNGGADNDYVQGGPGADVLGGGSGRDELRGGSGDDVLNGGARADALYGDAGNDTLVGSEGADRLYGGPGKDKLSGGAGKDILMGGADADTMKGGADGDSLRGEGGVDTMSGGPGEDSLFGGPGADRLSGGGGDDYLEGEEGDDEMRGGIGKDDLWGGPGNDGLWGGSGNDYLHGGTGRDGLDGGGGVDYCVGGPGTYEAAACETVTSS